MTQRVINQIGGNMTIPPVEPEVIVITDTTEPTPVYSSFRKIMLATMGILALTQEEIEAFIKKAIERGMIAEKEGRKLAEEMAAKQRQTQGKVEDEMSKRVENMLQRMNIPTKTDMQVLSIKVDELSKKIDGLGKEKRRTQE